MAARNGLMKFSMAETSEIHLGTALSGRNVALGAAVVSGAVGFNFGPTMLNGLTYFWTELLLPTFSLIYLYGVALCT